MLRQVFLMGICFPLYVVHSKDSQFNMWDVVATLVCLTGVTVAYFADSQLHNFVYGTTHAIWWWGLAIFAWNLDCGWSFIGAFINILCLAYVTVLVEERMLKQEYRVEAYKKYQKTTLVWIPWFKK
ncbi:hypothetical protein ACS0TY_021456 [Phlomoides rotata]